MRLFVLCRNQINEVYILRDGDKYCIANVSEKTVEPDRFPDIKSAIESIRSNPDVVGYSEAH